VTKSCRAFTRHCRRCRTHPVIRDYLTLMLFTGLRRGETSRLRWENIDLVRRVLTVPAESTKAGKKLELPLSDYVYDLLVARRAIGNAGGYVFPGRSAGRHIITTSAPLRAVAKACGVTVAAHDLRRTFITVAESVDISPMALRAFGAAFFACCAPDVPDQGVRREDQ
jgi:integrase